LIDSGYCVTVGIRDCFNDLKVQATGSQNAWVYTSVLLNLLSGLAQYGKYLLKQILLPDQPVSQMEEQRCSTSRYTEDRH